MKLGMKSMKVLDINPPKSAFPVNLLTAQPNGREHLENILLKTLILSIIPSSQ